MSPLLEMRLAATLALSFAPTLAAQTPASPARLTLERIFASGEFAARRREQQVKWMWSMLESRMMARLRSDASIRARVKKTEADVADGKTTPAVAAEQIAEWLK